MDQCGESSFGSPSTYQRHLMALTADHLIDVLDLYSEMVLRWTTLQEDEKVSRVTRLARTHVPKAVGNLENISTSLTSCESAARDRLVRSWTRFGTHVVKVPVNDDACHCHGCPHAGLDKRPIKTFPFVTCAYPLCHCYGKRAVHKMRVCTGCYKVYYCSRCCQSQ